MFLSDWSDGCQASFRLRLSSLQSILQLAATVRPPACQGVMWSASISGGRVLDDESSPGCHVSCSYPDVVTVRVRVTLPVALTDVRFVVVADDVPHLTLTEADWEDAPVSEELAVCVAVLVHAPPAGADHGCTGTAYPETG